MNEQFNSIKMRRI